MAKYSDIRNSDVYKKAFEKAFQKAVKNNPNRIKEMAQQHTETAVSYTHLDVYKRQRESGDSSV